MVKKTMKSGFVSRMLKKGGREAFDAHKANETNYGKGGNLPPGITGGVAELVDCRFGQYKKGVDQGENFFIAAGVVKEPLTHNGIRIEGLHTQIIEPLCDTPRLTRKTLNEHFKWVVNELQKLSADTSELNLEDLEGVAQALAEGGIHFRFHTWIGDKQTSGPYKDLEPRTREEWDGACEYEESEESEGVVDNTPDVEEEEDEQSSLLGLAELADNGDEAAQLGLTKHAESVGLDPDEYETWAELAEAISPDTTGEDEEAEEEDDEESEDEEEEEEEEHVPEKSEVYWYKPPKKKKKKECVCTAVFHKKRTCNLKNLDDNTVYKTVPWDKLEDTGG